MSLWRLTRLEAVCTFGKGDWLNKRSKSVLQVLCHGRLLRKLALIVNDLWGCFAGVKGFFEDFWLQNALRLEGVMAFCNWFSRCPVLRWEVRALGCWPILNGKQYMDARTALGE
jgi:hypothetical protein